MIAAKRGLLSATVGRQHRTPLCNFGRRSSSPFSRLSSGSAALRQVVRAPAPNPVNTPGQI